MLVSMVSDIATKQMSEEASRMSAESRGNKSGIVNNSVIPDDSVEVFSVDDFLSSVGGASKEDAEAAFAGLTSEQQEAVLEQVTGIDTLINLLPAEFQEAIESAMMSLFQMPILQQLMKGE